MDAAFMSWVEDTLSQQMSRSSGFSNLSDLLLDRYFQVYHIEKKEECDPCRDAQAHSNLLLGDARKMDLNLQEQPQCLSE